MELTFPPAMFDSDCADTFLWASEPPYCNATTEYKYDIEVQHIHDVMFSVLKCDITMAFWIENEYQYIKVDLIWVELLFIRIQQKPLDSYEQNITNKELHFWKLVQLTVITDINIRCKYQSKPEQLLMLSPMLRLLGFPSPPVVVALHQPQPQQWTVPHWFHPNNYSYYTIAFIFVEIIINDATCIQYIYIYISTSVIKQERRRRITIVHHVER